MDSLTLNLNRELLLDLMKNFYVLTNIKIALFDTNGYEVLSYPYMHCPFCAYVRSFENGARDCLDSNRRSFERCQHTGNMEIYKCHAGLIETTVPLIDNGVVTGYIMFGQITDETNSSNVSASLSSYVSRYNRLQPKGVDASIYRVTYKTRDQIIAAAKILEACTFYVLLKDMVSLHRKTFMENLDSFLLDHLSEDLSIGRLTQEFHISKNKLYESCSKYLSTGIAEHIKKLRLDEAKRLLTETDLPVYEISERIGFSDYNYFCRTFKKEIGMPARQYRRSERTGLSS